MKLRIDQNRTQPDPFIFKDDDRFYLYVTAAEGVECYTAKEPMGEWEFLGNVGSVANGHSYWAPSVIRVGETYYMYVSCETPAGFQHMHVLSAKSPEGPFGNAKMLYDRFSIDSHAVKTKEGLFLFFAQNNTDCEKKGTRVFVDRMSDPYTPENDPKEIITPDFDEEKFTPQCTEEGDWYTLEGPFYFYKDGWHYLMYSGGCYQDDTYHIGYATSRGEEEDLCKLTWTKHTNGGAFAPTLIRNQEEEGTGHHSVLFYRGEYYAVYHGRDIKQDSDSQYVERRTARICRLLVENGRITAERM